jgi:hypothetical protein
MVKLNKSQDRTNAMRSEGKTIILNQVEHLEVTKTFNQISQQVKNDFQIKNSRSQISAALVLLR